MAVYFGANKVNILGGQPITSEGEKFVYSVDNVPGASYGFALNDNGYYESQNKGVHNSYAICRVNLTVVESCDITFKVINFAENSCDYAVFGTLDTALYLTNDVTNDSIFDTFRNRHSENVEDVVYSNVSAGTHSIDVKFRKDGSVNSGNDSVQFKIESGILHEGAETNGIDTSSDVPATASDIASGKEAFVNGQKVTGNLTNVDASSGRIFSECSLTSFSDYLLASIKVSKDMIFRSGASVSAEIPFDRFGDAEIGHVLKDYKFTSKDGMNLVGTYVPPESLDISSDNPAFESDIASGKVAFVNGAKVTGNVTVQDTQYLGDYEAIGGGTLTNGGKYMFPWFKPTKDVLVRAGTTLGAKVPYSDFGDAEVGHVLKDKKFTSKDGRNLVGTYVPPSSGYQSGSIVKAYPVSNVTIGSGTSAKVNYGSSVSASNGVVSISSPTSLTISSTSSLDVTKGKYIQQTATYGTTTYPVYFVPDNATFTEGGQSWSKTYSASTLNEMFVLA